MATEQQQQQEEARYDSMDPETAFLLGMKINSKHAAPPLETSGFEWDKFKENVRPLKRGRNVKLLNDALISNSDLHFKKSLLLTRRRLIEAIDEYKGDDPLQPWLECIKWVQEAFPAGGDSSGLVIIYEQCVRTFWHDDRYKNDLRYLKVWLEYAENCADAEVIFRFLDANKIGRPHSDFYISYALHVEAKNKIKTADELFNQGLSLNAQPLGKLEAAYRKFLARSMRRPKPAADEGFTDNSLQMRSFGTVLSCGENRRQASESSNTSRKIIKRERDQRVLLSIYDDNVQSGTGSQADLSKTESKSWDNLATLKDRNKENKAIPGKWTSYKIPQRPGHGAGEAATTNIDVFVDHECSEMHKIDGVAQTSSNFQLKERKEREIKRETELLRENPLRNFPTSSFPR